MDNKNELICASCKGRNFGSFIHFGSLTLKCLDCKADGPATSFSAVSINLTGNVEALEVDEFLNPKGIIFKGDIKIGIEKIKTEAQKGKIIQLITAV